jgi:hypothetical protein
MYMHRPISVCLGYILSIVAMCASSTLAKSEEKPEILRGPAAERAQPPPKPAVSRCGNLINRLCQRLPVLLHLLERI